MDSLEQPSVIPPASGRTLDVVGDRYRFMVTGAETGGRYTTIEAIVFPGGGPPPHVHRREVESFYVLEGEMTFWVGEQRQVAGPGTFIHMPIGVAHRFKNETEHPARMIISVMPAGIEGYFYLVGEEPSNEAPAKPNAEQIELLISAAAEYGIEFV